MPGLDDMIEIIQQTGIFTDVLRFGLNTVLDLKTQGHLLPVFLRVRKKFQRLNAAEFGDVVEFFAKDRYLTYSSIANNLTFGFAQKEAFREENLATNDYFKKFLQDSDLWRPLLDLGAEICRRAVDIFGSILPDEFFLESAPFEPAEYSEIKQIAERLKAAAPAELTAREHQKLLELALRFVPGRHKMVAVPEAFTRQILRQRPLFKKKISADRPAAFTFFHKTVYLSSFSILNNIFFGRLKVANPRVEESINQRIIRLLIEEGIIEKVLEIGMQFQVGSRGDRLSGGQRQKLAIARVLLKKPPVLILDEATSALDNKSQARIQGLLETHWKGRATVIAVAHRLDTVKNFDRIILMKAGQICESGTYAELMERRGPFYDLALGAR
jgi:ABC-type polar amino acid transport system ATPase subunit